MFRIISRYFSTKERPLVKPVKELISKKPVGSFLSIKGWATSVRKMGEVIFLDINDGSCFSHLQVVISKENLMTKIQNGSSLSINGTLQISQRGQLELHAEDVHILGGFDITDGFPFSIKSDTHKFDEFRNYLHFRPKAKLVKHIMRCRSAAALKIHQYFTENEFTLIHPPILTSSDCENSAETFLVKPESQALIDSMKKPETSNDTAFFNIPAYLSVSGQLHLEVYVRSIAKVYSFNPFFRAENSVSRFHLSEFYMVEAEEAFITDLESIMQRIEDLVKQTMSYLLSEHMNEIEFILKNNSTDVQKHINMLENAINKPFAIMTFTEAKQLLSQSQDKFKKSSSGFTKAEEVFLVEHNNSVPVFIVDWPENEKPFYMKPTGENTNLVKGVDLLVPLVGELCGGSVREDDYDTLKQKLTDLKLLNPLKWYLDIRKFGNVPSGGFGLGFERFLQFFLNIQSIKDTIPFPRWPHHLHL